MTGKDFTYMPMKVLKEYFREGKLLPDMVIRCGNCQETKPVLNNYFDSAILKGTRRCKKCVSERQMKHKKYVIVEVQTEDGVVECKKAKPLTVWQKRAVYMNQTGYKKWTAKACLALYEAFEKRCVITGEELDASSASFLAFDPTVSTMPETGVLVQKSARRIVGPMNRFAWSDEQKQRISAAHAKIASPPL